MQLATNYTSMDTKLEMKKSQNRIKIINEALKGNIAHHYTDEQLLTMRKIEREFYAILSFINDMEELEISYKLPRSAD